MAKLWTSLSLLLVFVMLLFLAPSLLLMPAQIVSADGEEVVQEVTATFSFNETEPGQWWPFTAGGGVIQPPGPCLEQYTRANVVRNNTNLSGCQFRNYTTGSGAVAGGLAGTLSLAWNTFNFNQTYPYTPIYSSGAYFGFIMGRGHIDEGGGNNFTIAFVADFDADSATMANAAGKGFLLSANETGTFSGCKIIGDFDFTKTGASWSGTFHLRNYAPNEVYNLSYLNVTGGVLQEKTDAIHTPLSLVNYVADGPFVTPTNVTTDFEEIAWGRDPIKNITSGRLGVNGTMDLSRNTALYLEVNAGQGWVNIQGTTACNLFINDTYAVTGDDGSPYGKLYELLLLYIPDQTLPLGEFFWQNGYTFTPFGMLNPSTDCYAGTESFAFATVGIESSVGPAKQDSSDISYGLYPHPKVASVSPASGAPGTTMNVTITGKYFLRVAGEKSGWVANAGSVSFGPNITVNSYSFLNSSPIDNAIIANITIAGGAGTAMQDVNVTSCFNYTFGNGTAPYKSGHGVFTVSSATGTLQGNVSFLSRGSNNSRLAEPFVVKGFDYNSGNLLWTVSATTSNTGYFTITDIPIGNYNITIKNWTCLSIKAANVTIAENSTTVVDFGTTREGDANGSDAVTGMDFSLLSGVFNSAPAGNPNCDFDRNNAVGGMDFSLLNGQFNRVGPLPPN